MSRAGDRCNQPNAAGAISVSLKARVYLQWALSWPRARRLLFAREASEHRCGGRQRLGGWRTTKTGGQRRNRVTPPAFSPRSSDNCPKFNCINSNKLAHQAASVTLDRAPRLTVLTSNRVNERASIVAYMFPQAPTAVRKAETTSPAPRVYTSQPRWPVLLSILGALTVSALLWVGIIFGVIAAIDWINGAS